MFTTTVGQLMLNSALPEDMRDYRRQWDKKTTQAVLQDVAERYPAKYRDISKQLMDIGRDAAYTSGGFSFGVDDLLPTPSIKASRTRLKRRIRDIMANEQWPEELREQKIIEATAAEQERVEKELMADAATTDNPLAAQVRSGWRGNPAQLKRLIGGDSLYVDHRENVIPVPIQRSYAEGLTPAEWYAASFGARKGLIDTKFATQDAGFFCLAAGTLVRMADWSSRAIEDIREGDMVLGADRDGRTFPVMVTATFANGQQQLHRFRFRYGKSRTRFLDIVATENHKALCEHLRRRRRRPDPKLYIETAIDVAPLGEYERRNVSWYSLIPPQGYRNRHGKQEPWAGLIGLLIAEGGLTTNHIGLSCGDSELLEAIKRYVAPRGFAIRKKTGAKYEYTIIDKDPLPAVGAVGGGIAIGSFRNRLQKKLAELDLAKKTAPMKHIPAVVDTWNNASIRELLRWLFAGDGSIGISNNSTIPTVLLGMTAEPVVRKVQELLANRFGIYGQISIANTKGKPCGTQYEYIANHDCVVLAISDRESVKRFAYKIGFVTGAKQNRLRDLLKLIAPIGRRDRFLFHFVGSEPLGLGETYDLEVDHPDHLFVLANGAIVSNSKQLNQLAHRLIVTQEDDEDDGTTPSTLRGFPVATADSDNEGALLAVDVGGYRKNVVLTPKILQDLRQSGIKRILVRSPAVGGPRSGGVAARDIGYRERGGFTPLGENVGLAAAQALSERITQGQLGSKHSGGLRGQAKAVTGFEVLNQLIQTPKTFKGGAAHSQFDGRVETIEPLPTGGHRIKVAGEDHFVAPGFKISVKPGDEVEAGDVLSEGIPNPAEIVKHKGIGDGREYFVRAFTQAFRDSNMPVHRRNVELMARGLIDHVEMVDEDNEHIPGDVVGYSQLERSWVPRQGYASVVPKAAIGKYLERPALHYTIGTKIRPRMLKDFDEFGVRHLDVHDEPPPFQPRLIRALDNAQHDPDWMVRFIGSNQKKSLLNAARRGGQSTQQGTSFLPSLVEGVDFGKTWPRDVIKQPKLPGNPL